MLLCFGNRSCVSQLFLTQRGRLHRAKVVGPIPLQSDAETAPAHNVVLQDERSEDCRTTKTHGRQWRRLGAVVAYALFCTAFYFNTTFSIQATFKSFVSFGKYNVFLDILFYSSLDILFTVTRTSFLFFSGQFRCSNIPFRF